MVSTTVVSTTASRRSRRWTIGVSLWAVVLPALLVLVRFALPSDDVLTVPPGQTLDASGVAVVPLGTVPGLRSGDVVVAVDGVATSTVLTSLAGRAVHAGQILDYRVRRGSGVIDVPVEVRAHPRVAALIGADQPDAALVAVVMAVLAGWLLRRRPHERSVHAFTLFAAGWLSTTLTGWAWPQVIDFWARPWYAVAADATLGGYLLSGVALLLFALAFPEPGPRVARRPWAAVAVVPLLWCAALAGWVATHGTRLGDFSTVNTLVEIVWQGCAIAALLTFAGKWWRHRRHSECRRRMQIVATGVAALVVAMLIGRWVGIPPSAWGFGLVLLVFPASIAVAISRRNLFELDVVLSRALVATSLTGLLLATYLAITTATAALTGSSGPLVSLPAAGVVAVAFAPLRVRLRTVIGHRLFGAAGDPALVFHRMGMRLETSDDPEALIAAVVDTAAETLRLPFVAMELATDGAWSVATQRGNRPDAVEVFPVSVGDREVGRLVVAQRRGASGLSPDDRRLLADLARHSGVAARVVALLTDLRVAQQRLLVAREAERHRIHRDLHDGVGPSLVGLTLQLEVAADLATTTELAALTRRLHAAAARATDDVRRIVRELRPGDLEELGLPAAVAAAAARLESANGPRITVDTPVQLPTFPAELEDAAYKICLEAMSNVIRHSAATDCAVSLASADGTLQLRVADNGRGFDPTVSVSGTGVASMHERASAVGGQLCVETSRGTGTTVVVTLPIAVPAPQVHELPHARRSDVVATRRTGSA